MLRRTSSSNTPSKHALEMEIAQIGDGMIVVDQASTNDHYTYSITMTAPAYKLRDWQKKVITDTLLAVTGNTPNERIVQIEYGEYFQAAGFITPTTAIAEFVSNLQNDAALTKFFDISVRFDSEVVRRRSSSVLSSGTHSPRALPKSPRPKAQ